MVSLVGMSRVVAYRMNLSLVEPGTDGDKRNMFRWMNDSHAGHASTGVKDGNSEL